MSYQYNLAGALKQITDHTGASLSYNFDKLGQLTSLDASGYNYTDWVNGQPIPHTVSQFVSNVKYRAWGAVQEANYGNNVQQVNQYNAHLLPSNSTLSNLQINGVTTSLAWNYDYYPDLSVRHAYDVGNNNFDRAYKYNALGQLQEALSGREARGESFPTGMTPDNPYKENYAYDAWGEITQQTGRVWFYTIHNYGYKEYDAGGNVVFDNRGENVFDAGNRQVGLRSNARVGGSIIGLPERYAGEAAYTYDGAGQVVKSATTNRQVIPPSEYNCCYYFEEMGEERYYLRSSVLNNYVVVVLYSDGTKEKGYVYANGQRLAEHFSAAQRVTWQHQNAVTGSWVTTAPNRVADRREMDPLGAEVGEYQNYSPPPQDYIPTKYFPQYLEIEGGPTGEAQLGRQLHNFFMNNAIYGGNCQGHEAGHLGCQQGSYGPGEGGAGIVEALERSFFLSRLGGGPFNAQPIMPINASGDDLIDDLRSIDDPNIFITTNLWTDAWVSSEKNGPNHWGAGSAVYWGQRNGWPFTGGDPRQIKPQIGPVPPPISKGGKLCDSLLASIFGGPGAVLGANGYATNGDYRGDVVGTGGFGVGHLSSYAAHMSGDARGQSNTDVYVPNYGKTTNYRNYRDDAKGQSLDAFYYTDLMGLKDVTLLVWHIDRSAHKTDGARVRIGRTGGHGGDAGNGGDELHVHMEILSGNWVKDPVRDSDRRTPYRIPFNRLCPTSLWSR